MADSGLEPRNAFICTEMAAVRALASRGLGVAVGCRARWPRSLARRSSCARWRLPADVAGRARLALRAAPVARGQAFLKVALEYAQQPSHPRLRAAA